jgi:hypothetical protein
VLEEGNQLSAKHQLDLISFLKFSLFLLLPFWPPPMPTRTSLPKKALNSSLSTTLSLKVSRSAVGYFLMTQQFINFFKKSEFKAFEAAAKDGRADEFQFGAVTDAETRKA